jgi:hypothetical protein
MATTIVPMNESACRPKPWFDKPTEVIHRTRGTEKHREPVDHAVAAGGVATAFVATAGGVATAFVATAGGVATAFVAMEEANIDERGCTHRNHGTRQSSEGSCQKKSSCPGAVARTARWRCMKSAAPGG